MQGIGVDQNEIPAGQSLSVYAGQIRSEPKNAMYSLMWDQLELQDCIDAEILKRMLRLRFEIESFDKRKHIFLLN